MGADKAAKNAGGVNAISKCPPVPEFKPTILFCKNTDDANQAKGILWRYSESHKIGDLNFTEYFSKDPIYRNNKIVIGGPTEYIRNRYNVVEFSQKEIDRFVEAIKAETERYNQQVRDYASYIAKELPDFKVEFEEDGYSGRLRATFHYAKEFMPKRETRIHAIPHLTLDFKKDVDDQLAELRRSAENFERENELMNKYPYLFVAIFDEDRISIRQRITKDRLAISGTAVGTFKADEITDDFLSKLNDECMKASQPGMFLCAWCCTAKPLPEYETHYFAYLACKSCRESHPEWVNTESEEIK